VGGGEMDFNAKTSAIVRKKPLVLHITNIYPTVYKKGNPIIKKIIETISSKGIFDQLVVVPVKTVYPMKLKIVENIQSLDIREIIIPVFGMPYGIMILSRLFLSARKIHSILSSRNIITKVALIHAHTLLSDGFIAYHLWKKYKIPYIVSVRSTDVNEQLKYILYVRPIAKKIIAGASKVICITPTIKHSLKKYLKINNYSSKILVVTTGIEKSFFVGPQKISEVRGNSIKRLIFVGNLIKLKNLHRVIYAIKEVIDKGLNLKLTVIGDGPEKGKLERLVSRLGLEKHVVFLGYKPHSEVINIMKEHDIFILASIKETFGLVYLEALSQGLPIIYSSGTGVDQVFNHKIGEPCIPNDVDSIASAIERVLENHEFYKKEVKKFLESEAQHFMIDQVAEEYQSIYKDVLEVWQSDRLLNNNNYKE